MPVNANVIRKDRFLSNFATKYKLLERVGDFIAPPFSVPRPTDTFAQFTKANFRIYNDIVARGEEAKEIEIDYTEGTYKCKKHELGTWIDNEDPFNMDGNWQIDKVKTMWVLDAHRIAREKRIIDIATNTALVTQNSTPSTKWDNASGTPVSDILAAMATVKQSSTMAPNAIVMTLPVALKLINTTDWKERFKYTTTGFPSLFNAIEGFKQLGLQPMIAGSFGVNTPQGSASDPDAELLLGKNCLLFYREQNPTLETRTFMYSPFHKWNEAIMRYPMPWKRGYKITALSSIDELLVDAQCAYLFTSVIS